MKQHPTSWPADALAMAGLGEGQTRTTGIFLQVLFCIVILTFSFTTSKRSRLCDLLIPADTHCLKALRLGLQQQMCVSLQHLQLICETFSLLHQPAVSSLPLQRIRRCCSVPIRNGILKPTELLIIVSYDWSHCLVFCLHGCDILQFSTGQSFELQSETYYFEQHVLEVNLYAFKSTTTCVPLSKYAILHLQLHGAIDRAAEACRQTLSRSPLIFKKFSLQSSTASSISCAFSSMIALVTMYPSL